MNIVRSCTGMDIFICFGNFWLRNVWCCMLVIVLEHVGVC